MAVKFYLDTSALVEVAKGNDPLRDYIAQDFVINDVTLAEFYSVMLREYDEQTANYWFKRVGTKSMSVTKELLVEAVKFRRYNKGKNLSFFDAVGYVYSVKNNHVFLTGDKDFEGLPGVEFVKK